MNTPSVKTATPRPEHLLAVVEPTTGGDTTMDLARATVDRGGRATVVMIISARVRRDIEAYGESENLGSADAEGAAIEQLEAGYRSRLGDGTDVLVRFRADDSDLVALAGEDITAIALPHPFASRRTVRTLSRRTGLPVVVAPAPAAA